MFRTVTVKIHDISQQLPYIVVNQADDNGKIIRFVPLDHGQKVTGFTGARLYYPPRSDNEYGDYVTGVESDGAWDFTIPVGVLSAGRVGCNLAFIDGDGETYSRNVVFLVEPSVSGVFDSEDGQQTRIDKIIGTVQTAADTAIDSINDTVDNAVERVNKTASDAVESIGKADESINESVTDARGSANAAAESAQQAAASAIAAQTSERNAANSATQASQYATAAKQSEDNAAESERNAASSERNAASSAEQAANIVASVSGSVTQAENAARSASQSATAASGSASVAGGSAQAAADSASKAGESATAAGLSERNAASSATQASQSATAAAQSASEAQNAVDGFGLEVGTTTTGEPGTDAVVSIAKQGTKYTANFTIPRGDVGPAGVNENVPLGTVSGIVAQATDAYPVLPRKVSVHGKTVENLCPVFNRVNNGVTFSTDDDGYISVKGTATNDIYEQPSIANFPQNSKVWLYVDSDFRKKGIDAVYAQCSGWSLYSIPNEMVSSTTPDATSGSLLIKILSGVTVDAKIRIMFMAGETEPDASLFVPSGVHTVEPEKLTVLGENLLDLSFISGNSNAKVSGDKVIFKVDVDGLNDSYTWNNVTGNPYNGDAKYLIPVIPNSRLHFKAETSEPITSSSVIAFYGSACNRITMKPIPNVSGNIQSLDFDVPATAAFISVRLGVRDAAQDVTITMRNICLTYADIEYVPPEKIETNLPSDIILADGYTLTIDRDGTTRILHAEGEPTVLENVTLPELPAPTFNVYTTGGYIQPTVDVDYEQDVNLVLQKFEAKIASLEVNQTIMQGA